MATLRSLSLLVLAHLAAAKPVPLPPSECTKTLVTFVGFAGNWAPTMTTTLYTSTVTAVSPVDCEGCASVTQVTSFFGGVGPVVQKLVTVTAVEPTTVKAPVCSPTLLHIPDPVVPVSRRDEVGCTSTRVVGITPHLGPTKTEYLKTLTTTSTVYCGGVCEAVAVSTFNGLHPGPVVIHKTTITLPETFTTTFACLPTDVVVFTNPLRPTDNPGGPNKPLPSNTGFFPGGPNRPTEGPSDAKRN